MNDAPYVEKRGPQNLYPRTVLGRIGVAGFRAAFGFRGLEFRLVKGAGALTTKMLTLEWWISTVTALQIRGGFTPSCRAYRLVIVSAVRGTKWGSCDRPHHCRRRRSSGSSGSSGCDSGSNSSRERSAGVYCSSTSSFPSYSGYS